MLNIDEIIANLVREMQEIAPEPQDIIVAMSGGVDSSVVALLLHQAGHRVRGITLQLYDQGLTLGRKGACCAGQDIYDAQMAAEKIGIPHYVLDYEAPFKSEVIDKFVDSYINGETPVPCILCNQKIKFRDLLKASRDLSANFLATGHYVRRIEREDGFCELHSGATRGKDQSYFLFATRQDELRSLLFPLGNMLDKEVTRAIAEHYGLTVAAKADSQDICFVPNGDYRKIVLKAAPQAEKSGDIVMSNGAIVGRHNGIINYTVGQRRGLNISHSEPLYVLKIDPIKNNIIVGVKDELKSRKFRIKLENWLGETSIYPDMQYECTVKLRSAHLGAAAIVRFDPLGAEKIAKNNWGAGEEIEAEVLLFQDYVGITPGQACVFYDGSRVMGGGWILRM
jgi:tRNA-specific 2-thiouridylase